MASSTLKVPKVALFTWNTQSCLIGSDDDFAFPPALWKEKPELIIVGTQEDRKPGGYLHSHVLPLFMGAEGYKAIEQTRIMGVGKTCYQGLWRGDFFLRGCRLSCYLRGDLLDLEAKTTVNYYFCSWLRNKGAVSISCTIPGYQPCLFINCHLPIESQGNKPGNDWLADAIRISLSNYYLNDIIKNLAYPLKQWPLIFVMGDLNYRCKKVSEEQIALWVGNYDFEPWLQLDEFRAQVEKENLPYFFEGKDNEGPRFFPTYKLQAGREPDSLVYRRGVGAHRTPAWTDRICGIFNAEVECLIYERWDNPLTIRSDHCAVWALYQRKEE